jgi:tRNA G18 (ribose-2'-O)-methylase SpoU
VGSVLRTADGAGITRVYLTGYTPAPIDRFGRKQSAIAKVALGAEDSVDWESAESISGVIEKLKKENIHIVAVEQSSGAIDYKKFKMEKSTAFIFGNEVDGLSEDILNMSDTIIEIPMLGEKESLNVSVSVGIILFANT